MTASVAPPVEADEISFGDHKMPRDPDAPCAQEAARGAFEGVDENGYRELGQIFDEQVKVIGFAVAGESVAVHLGKHLCCAPAKPRQRLGVEDFAPILLNADQVDRKT